MDFLYVALATSLAYALLPANFVRFLALGLATFLFRVIGVDPTHTLIMGPAAFFVAYSLNAIVDRLSAAMLSPAAIRLRRGLPDV